MNHGTNSKLLPRTWGKHKTTEANYIIKDAIGIWIATEEARRGRTIPYGSTEAEGEGLHYDPTPLYSKRAQAFR
eukprot:14389683-Heterocapsa_arctica.AAC.1